MLDINLFKEPKATELEGMRNEARGKRRIIYDCLNAELDENGVSCPLHRLNERNLVTSLQVMRGWTPSICQKCEDYREEG